MNQRFVLTTFAACVFMFAAIFALTAPKARPAPAARADAPAAVMYADCAAVHAAGITSLRADQPGYRPALDGNMNGIACEPVGGPPPPTIAANPPPSVDPAPDNAPPPEISAPPSPAPVREPSFADTLPPLT